MTGRSHRVTVAIAVATAALLAASVATVLYGLIERPHALSTHQDDEWTLFSFLFPIVAFAVLEGSSRSGSRAIESGASWR